jgi:G:T-mismatch repair DNA endonuclease (very short patch repair protein)
LNNSTKQNKIKQNDDRDEKKNKDWRCVEWNANQMWDAEMLVSKNIHKAANIQQANSLIYIHRNVEREKNK